MKLIRKVKKELAAAEAAVVAAREAHDVAMDRRAGRTPHLPVHSADVYADLWGHTMTLRATLRDAMARRDSIKRQLVRGHCVEAA